MWGRREVCAQLGAYLESQTGWPVCSAGNDGDRRLPPAIAQFPLVLVYPGTWSSIIAAAGQTRQYEVSIDIVAGSADVGLAAYDAVGLEEAIIQALLVNVRPAPNAYIVGLSSSGITTIDYGGMAYTGIQISVSVVEDQQVEVQA